MPDIGFLELLLVGVIAFLVLGPERMPELFAQVGRLFRKGRDWISDVKSQVDSEVAPLSTHVADIKSALSDSDISKINDEIMEKEGRGANTSAAGDSADKKQEHTI